MSETLIDKVKKGLEKESKKQLKSKHLTYYENKEFLRRLSEKMKPTPTTELPENPIEVIKKVHEIIHRKQHKVHERWEELSKSGMEPTRREVLAGIYDALQDVLDELNSTYKL